MHLILASWICTLHPTFAPLTLHPMSAPCKYSPHQEAAPCLLNSHPSSSSCIQNPTSAPCIPCPLSASLPCTCSHIYISYPAPRILHPKIPHPPPAPCPVWPRRAAPVAPSQPSSRRAAGVPRSQPSTSGVWRFLCPQGLRPPPVNHGPVTSGRQMWPHWPGSAAQMGDER